MGVCSSLGKIVCIEAIPDLASILLLDGGGDPTSIFLRSSTGWRPRSLVKSRTLKNFDQGQKEGNIVGSSLYSCQRKTKSAKLELRWNYNYMNQVLWKLIKFWEKRHHRGLFPLPSFSAVHSIVQNLADTRKNPSSYTFWCQWGAPTFAPTTCQFAINLSQPHHIPTTASYFKISFRAQHLICYTLLFASS